MKTKDPLKEVEKKAYRSIFEDGIYDIFFGMLFIILALIPVIKSAGVPAQYGYILGIIPAVFPFFGKKYITIPRLGQVEFGQKRKAKKKLLLLISIAVIVMMFPLLLMTSKTGFPGSSDPNLSTSIVLVFAASPLLLIAAYFLDYPRMYIYVLVLCAGIPHADFMKQFTGSPLNVVLSFGIAGAVITVYGLNLLFKFIKKYPGSSGEVTNVSE